MDPDKLKNLIDDDDLGLLTVKPKASKQCTADERLVESFEAINKFIDENGDEPQACISNVAEYTLYSRLTAIRQDKQKIISLMYLDRHGLLEKEFKEIKSLQDVYSDDDLGLLNNNAEDIFNLKHIPKERTMPDYVAKRKPCKDFKKFEELFKECQKDLREGKRTLSECQFDGSNKIEKSMFFVLRGILLYIDKVGESKGTGKLYNPRLRCIFENGTESDLLLRSLEAALYLDGRRVSLNTDTEKIAERFSGITEEDKETGFIYILKSLSKDPKIQSINNLYKIGFSKTPVEERIKNAEQEPTYLMAPVSIVASFKCFNLNPQKFEQLLHTFFGAACLNIDIFDNNGKRHMPREWFVAPLDMIQDAIQLLLNGEIVKYKYDSNSQEILEREN